MAPTGPAHAAILPEEDPRERFRTLAVQKSTRETRRNHDSVQMDG
jgi:hypothetical protein